MKWIKRISTVLIIALMAIGMTAAAADARRSWRVYVPQEHDVYGVSWDESQADTALTRTGTLVGFVAGQSPGNANLPLHSQMRRCILNDAGQVVYFLDGSDSTLKEIGGAADLSGTDGQVMVQIPKFYVWYEHSGTTHTWQISLGYFSGAVVHPAFVKNGVEVDYRYIGAYEAWTDGSTQLASVSGQLPTVAQTIFTFRTRAEARGAGWHQMDWYLYNAVTLLYLTEYADLNAQATIGDGVTDYEAWPNVPPALTGNSNSIGNATGNLTLAVDKWNASTAYSLDDEAIPDAAQNGYTYRVTVAGTSDAAEPTWPTTIGLTVVDGTVTWECVRHAGYQSYRGIENSYGHIYKFIDGVNVHNSAANGSRLYTAQDYTDFASDTDTGYTLITADLSQAAGWVKTLVPTSHGFIPMTVGGSSSTYLSDYYYTEFDTVPDGGWRVVFVGGVAANGSSAGPFCLSSYYGSSYAASIVGGRLCF